MVSALQYNIDLPFILTTTLHELYTTIIPSVEIMQHRDVK